ncbi:hydroxymethylglutaryl-CoA reductase, degradative [Weissella cibaria]|uniref:hydroxymethylglutaryl-CoA reductase, degradative n=1 Tax=Weissella cibaria TaxID=137591 RepID=UPI00106E1247|nr:hydroxymethylglutaryl-CoA reductase, degradative [Weissella cibaria]
MANWQGFYKLSWQQRLQRTIENKNLTADQAALITQHYDMVGEQQVENYLYNFGVPTGLLLELPVDGRLVTVPMSTEEPSVIAAANNGSRMMRAGAGVQTVIESRLVRGQIILDNVANVAALQTYVETHLTQLLQVANDAHPSMAKRGGGAKALTVEVLDTQTAIVNVLVDPKAAMGANVVNTMSEAIASVLRQAGYEVLMAILSNFATESLVKAKVAVPVTALATKQGMSGTEVAAKIAAASRIETLSPYRAVTSNKGMLNGIEAAVLASGNDTRAVNAALHAYAAQGGQYRGLTRWTVRGEELLGETTLPLILGVVGGSIGIVPAVKFNHALMDNPTVNELTSTIAAVGLAQNLAAIRALVSTGIQAGHMALQAKSLALQVGATPAEVPALTAALQQAGKFNEATARELLAKLR